MVVLIMCCLSVASGTTERGHGGLKREERNGWGSWADAVVGEGELPTKAEHPMQTWIHHVMKELGGRMMTHEADDSSASLHRVHLGDKGQARWQGLAGGDANATESGDERGDLIPIAIGDRIAINESTFYRGVEGYISEHTDETRPKLRFIVFLGVVVLAATGAFLYSEIRYVLLMRDLDELVVQGLEEIPKELGEKRDEMESQRLYWIGGSAAAIFLALTITLTIVCNFVVRIPPDMPLSCPCPLP